MFPDTTADFPDFNDVRRALQLESPAPDVACEEAEASPSLHVEVEEDGARGLGTHVQPPAPEFPDAAELAAHNLENSSPDQLN